MQKFIRFKKYFQKDQQTITASGKVYRESLQEDLIDICTKIKIQSRT